MRFLMKAAVLAFALTLSPAVSGQSVRLLVGTYTEGTSAEGIYLCAFDPETAGIRPLSVVSAGNPSFVITSPNGKEVYAVNEYGDGRQGISAFARVGDSLIPTARLTIPESSVDGADPCNLLYTGDALVSSNYSGGSVTSFALDGSGVPRALTQSFAAEHAHMHCAVLSPDGRYIFVADLGRDCIHRFERGTGGRPLGAQTLAWSNPDPVRKGPRHLIFSADGRFAYLLCELSDHLLVFSYADGVLTPIQTLRAYSGKGHGSADLHLSPDGRFLYTSHRLKKDGVAIFKVNAKTGKVRKAGFQPTGTHPRNFALSPDGRFLLCACRDDNRIEIYRRDEASGRLRSTGQSLELGAPVCIQFLP